MANADSPLVQAVEFGAKVAVFLESDVGKYLTKKADDEEREALEGLATVNAFEPEAIRSLQAQAWRANSFLGWLKEALEAAHEAHRELEHQEKLPDSSV